MVAAPVDPQRSVLSQLKDPLQYPELTHVSSVLSNLRIYQNWEFGQTGRARDVSQADASDGTLEEDGSNLGIVLNRLLSQPVTGRKLRECLKAFDNEVEDVYTTIKQGTVEISVQYRGLQSSIPSTRLSDGMIRWLFLLSVLLDPAPSPLICIEEPELGMHPDIIPEVAKLLNEASQRTQLIVTTHSAQLIDEFSDQPEAVLVCEKTTGRTVMKRYSRHELGEWLGDYALGQLWRQGHIGGNRW